MDKTPHEMIEILTGNNYGNAKKFVLLGERLDCKTMVRWASGHKTWKCVVQRKKPSRALFTLECAEGKWGVKACLWKIDTYRDFWNCVVIPLKGLYIVVIIARIVAHGAKAARHLHWRTCITKNVWGYVLIFQIYVMMIGIV